MSYITNIFTA